MAKKHLELLGADDMTATLPICEEMPSLTAPTPSINSLDDVLDEIMRDDIERLNHVLMAQALAWKRAYFVDDICRLSNATIKTLITRRQLMLLPTHNSREDEPTKSKYYEPIEIEGDNSAGWDRPNAKILPDSH